MSSNSTDFAKGASGPIQVYNIGAGPLDVLPAGLVAGQSSVASAAVPGVPVQHNEVAVASEPNLDFKDSTQLTWTVTDDDPNDRVQVMLALAHLMLRGPDDTTQYRFAFGTSTGNTNPNTYGPVSYGVTFSAPPKVFVVGLMGVSAGTTIGSRPSNISAGTSSFTMTCGGAGADLVDIFWLAIGAA